MSRRAKLGVAVLITLPFVVGVVFVVLELQSQPANPIAPLASPTTPYYLPYPRGLEEDSRILVLAESVNYTSYPFESVPKYGSTPAVNKGDQCIRINATVRSDYNLENPLPGTDLTGNNGTVVYVYLSAKIYNAQGKVDATDVTPPYPMVPLSGILLQMTPGEVDNVAIYLATDNLDITSYEVNLQAIGTMPVP
jgi:hypothetical protein